MGLLLERQALGFDVGGDSRAFAACRARVPGGGPGSAVVERAPEREAGILFAARCTATSLASFWPWFYLLRCAEGKRFLLRCVEVKQRGQTEAKERGKTKAKEEAIGGLRACVLKAEVCEA